MSNIIGTGSEQGTLKCFLHDFETLDIEEWNEHCINEGHTDSGTTQCIDCKTGITFTDIPFQRITPAGKQIQLRCPECFGNYTSQKLKVQVTSDIPKGEEGSGEGTVQPPLQQVEEAPDAEEQVKQNPRPKFTGRVI